MRVPWTARRSRQSILKKINPEYSLEGLMLKLQYFGHLMLRADSLEKTLMLGKIEEEKERTEDEMVGWHHRLNGHEFEQALADGDGQENLACCSPWGRKESRTQLSNWTEQITKSFSLPLIFMLRSPVLRKYCVLLCLVFCYDWGLQLEERAVFYSYLSQYNMEQRQHKVGA